MNSLRLPMRSLAPLGLVLMPLPRPVAATLPQGQFWTALASVMASPAGWERRALALSRDGTLRLAPSTLPLACDPADIDGGAAAFDVRSGLCAGYDPYAAGTYEGRNYYNGGHFLYGALLSPRRVAATPFDHAIASWVATTPPGTWLQVHLRVRLGSGIWTRWYALPVWSSDVTTMQRHSVGGQGGAATVQTDTLVLQPGRAATAFQLGVTFFTTGASSPTLYRLSLALSRAPANVPAQSIPVRSSVWGRDLAVQTRSQMLARYRESAYGGGGEVWCSPTSTAMILAYWAHRLGRADLDQSVPTVAAATYDWTYQGTGNWPFNVAYATSFAGMDGYVARLPSLAAAERWIAAGVPLALSIAFTAGALLGAPLPASSGHLLVLRGFDHLGNPIVNDPAAPGDTTVRRVYPRAALERAWQGGSGGTVYIIYPRGWRVTSTASRE